MAHKHLSTHIRFPVLLAVAAVAATISLATPRPAHALMCGDEHDVIGVFTDCSGTQNFADGDGGNFLEHHFEDDGVFAGTDWVSDLHFSFATDVAEITSATFVNLSDGVEWDATIDGLMVWFVSPTIADVLDPGEQFDWLIEFNFVSFPTGSVTFAMDYTMDIPEPSTLALFGIGLAGLGVLNRRRKRNLVDQSS